MNDGIFVLLGSNLGDRAANLRKAITMIGELPGIVLRQSAVYQTAAWGKTDQPDFFNQVIRLESTLDPEELLTGLLDIERRLGRERLEKWGPRAIDLDILFYHQRVVNLPHLTIPHPQLHLRRFTLVPLAEIAHDKIHPVLHQSVEHLLELCPDPLPVHRANV